MSNACRCAGKGLEFCGCPEPDPIERGLLERVRRAVEMASECAEVAPYGPPGDSLWTARIWGGSDWVVGSGPDAWTAVQSAHALREMELNRRYG